MSSGYWLKRLSHQPASAQEPVIPIVWKERIQFKTLLQRMEVEQEPRCHFVDLGLLNAAQRLRRRQWM